MRDALALYAFAPWFYPVVVTGYPAALETYADDAGVFPRRRGHHTGHHKIALYARLVCVDAVESRRYAGGAVPRLDGRGWQRGQGEPAWRYFDTLWYHEKWEVDYVFALWEAWRNHPGVEEAP